MEPIGITFFKISKKHLENRHRLSQMNITAHQKRQKRNIEACAFQNCRFPRQNLLIFEKLKKKTRKNKQDKALNGEQK